MGKGDMNLGFSHQIEIALSGPFIAMPKKNMCYGTRE